MILNAVISQNTVTFGIVKSAAARAREQKPERASAMSDISGNTVLASSYLYHSIPRTEKNGMMICLNKYANSMKIYCARWL